MHKNPDTQHPVLTAEAVSVRRDGRTVLEDVTFSAGEEFVLVVGPNGAGKTTLFHAVLGLVPHSGRICVEGDCGRGRATKVGYVPQTLRVEAPATLWEYVYLPAKFKGATPEAAREAIREVGLEGLEDRPAARLSGGQLQRAAIARALAAEPHVLLLDEPLANVDPQGRLELLALLRQLKRGRTILMASHDLTLPAALADKVLLLNRRAVAYGPPSQVLREEVLRRVYSMVKIAETPHGHICVTEDYGHHP